MRLTVVTAGLSVPSSSRLLADRLAAAVERRAGDSAGTVETTVVELRPLAVDIAHHLVTGFPPPALAAALEAVAAADGLVAVTPVFAASYSGLFKSFVDLLDREALVGTPVLLGATGGTARHSLALEYAMRPLFAHLRAAVVPTAVFAAPEDWGSAGEGRRAALAGRVERAAGELVALMPVAGRAPSTGGGGDAEEVVPFEEQLAALRGDLG
ncbi:CE1759 family FMN reductase [Streptomyces sp. NPDC059851]|uniref:CE1759 family FMN reductase n=1 Tax=Streptomyces sp. NPDC059851 TaxID=3346971 RepID=UPI003648D516